MLSWDTPADWFPTTRIEQGIDWRHCCFLRQICSHKDINSVLEIGSYAGHSTSAFINAAVTGDIRHVQCVDLTPQPALKAMLSTVPKDLANLVETESLMHLRHAEKYRWTYDLVFLDGDHTHPTVWEEWRYVSRYANVVALHDTSYHMIHRPSDGPVKALQDIMATEGWVVFQDALHRKGERTERGLAVAVRAEMVDLVRHVRGLYRELISEGV